MCDETCSGCKNGGLGSEDDNVRHVSGLRESHGHTFDGLDASSSGTEELSAEGVERGGSKIGTSVLRHAHAARTGSSACAGGFDSDVASGNVGKEKDAGLTDPDATTDESKGV